VVDHNGGVRLDHISYACGPDGLDATGRRIAGEVGAGIQQGGIHPSFGTTNQLLPLADRTYLEVVAVLEHPAADKAPFGRGVKRRTATGGGWLGWVVAVDDIAPIEQRLGRPAVPGHRHRPDGFDLRWRQIGVDSMLSHPELPYFIQWEINPAEHPAAAADPAFRLERIQICGDRRGLDQWLGMPVGEVMPGVEVEWVEGNPGIVTVEVATPHGPVRL
jgi:hypothetical protein